MTENVIDIETRKKIERINNPPDDNQQRFMKRRAKTIKDGKFKSICIVVMDDDNFCDYGILTEDTLQEALFGYLLDDIRNEIKDNLFGYTDLDDDEGEE